MPKPKADDRPTIRVRPGDLHLTATEAERALLDGGAPIFIRGGQLCRPIVDEVPAARGGTTRIARLKAASPDLILDHLSRSAVWERYDRRRRDWVATDPPRPVALTILARDGEWQLRQLAGVTTTPTIRPDGSILARPGYDSATRLLLLDPPTMPNLSEKPNRSEASRAIQLLDELLDGFPFVDQASRSVALSVLLTPIARGSMDVAPLHVATAPTPGSGKSFLVDLAAALAIGQRAAVISAGQSAEELEKRLHAALLGGQALVSIDNLNGRLTGDALCQMVERPLIEVRPLGRSTLVRIESRATLFATGNNIRLVGDMTRRAIVASLDPKVERPELREFDFDPFARILDQRGRYIAAALTIIRAYMAAGCPRELPPLASFEQWSRTVRSALVWLGRADPVETMEAARAGDPELASLRAVLTAWYDVLGDRQYRVSEVRERADERDVSNAHHYPDFHRALTEVAGNRTASGIDGRRLGAWLGRYQGRIVDGIALHSDWDAHAKQLVWRVMPCG